MMFHLNEIEHPGKYGNPGTHKSISRDTGISGLGVKNKKNFNQEGTSGRCLAMWNVLTTVFQHLQYFSGLHLYNIVFDVCIVPRATQKTNASSQSVRESGLTPAEL